MFATWAISSASPAEHPVHDRLPPSKLDGGYALSRRLDHRGDAVSSSLEHPGCDPLGPLGSLLHFLLRRSLLLLPFGGPRVLIASPRASVQREEGIAEVTNRPAETSIRAISRKEVGHPLT